jgi:hypothetical protein
MPCSTATNLKKLSFLIGTWSCKGNTESGLSDIPSEFASSIESFYASAKLDANYQSGLDGLLGLSLDSIESTVPDTFSINGEKFFGLGTKIRAFAAASKKNSGYKSVRELLNGRGALSTSLKARDIDTGVNMIRDFARAENSPASIENALSKYSLNDTARATNAMIIVDAIDKRYGKSTSALNLDDTDSNELNLNPVVVAGVKAGAEFVSAGAKLTTAISESNSKWQKGNECKNKNTASKADTAAHANWVRCDGFGPQKPNICDKDHADDTASGGVDSGTQCSSFRWKCVCLSQTCGWDKDGLQPPDPAPFTNYSCD